MSDYWLETYKSLITLSIERFKFSAFANGGAAVALLAYLGNIAQNNSHPRYALPNAHVLNWPHTLRFCHAFWILNAVKIT